jgi:hypothetical protein
MMNQPMAWIPVDGGASGHSRATIIPGQSGSPGNLGEVHAGKADVENEQRNEGFTGGDARLGLEQQPGAQHQQKGTSQDPGAELPPPAARVVHQCAQQRIERNVDDPHQRKDEADRCQR